MDVYRNRNIGRRGVTTMISIVSWLATIVVASFFLASTQAEAGKLECMFSCEIGLFGTGIEWESTDCHKPYQPSFFVIDTNSFNRAVDEFNDYVGNVQRYIDCLVSEANQDLRQLPNIISEGVESAESEVLSEVEAVRSDLETSRMFLQ